MARLTFATGVFFILLVVGSYFVLGTFIRGQEIDAPDLTARSVTEALEVLKKWNLTLVLEREEPSETLPPGEILSQRPAPGSKIKTRTPINVIVSSGQKTVTIPGELIGTGRLQAGIRLRELGIEVGEIAYVPRAGQGNDLVLATDPPPGTGVPPGVKVNLLVSSDAGAQMFLMPNLAGLTPADATAELAKYGLTRITARQAADAEATSGTVHAQNPKAGTPVSPGTEVELVVAP